MIGHQENESRDMGHTFDAGHGSTWLQHGKDLELTIWTLWFSDATWTASTRVQAASRLGERLRIAKKADDLSLLLSEDSMMSVCVSTAVAELRCSKTNKSEAEQELFQAAERLLADPSIEVSGINLQMQVTKDLPPEIASDRDDVLKNRLLQGMSFGPLLSNIFKRGIDSASLRLFFSLDESAYTFDIGPDLLDDRRFFLRQRSRHNGPMDLAKVKEAWAQDAKLWPQMAAMVTAAMLGR